MGARQERAHLCGRQDLICGDRCHWKAVLPLRLSCLCPGPKTSLCPSALAPCSQVPLGPGPRPQPPETSHLGDSVSKLTEDVGPGVAASPGAGPALMAASTFCSWTFHHGKRETC